MNKQNSIEAFSLTVPISFDAHVAAKKYSQLQSTPEKAKQVYLNTLAVSVTEFYLRCLGLETDWQASDSADPLMQALLNTADLWVNGYGSLECRPVLPGATFCYIPAEVSGGRIGYVAVRISESLQEATLLGFAEKANSEQLSFYQLRSLAELPEYLQQLKHQPTNLGNWLQGVFESSWRAIETLFVNSEETSSAFRYKSGIVCWKQIDWEDNRGSVNLTVILEPKQASEEIDITAEISPIQGQSYLPSELQILLLDETESVVMEARAKKENERIKFTFEGEPEDSFSIRIALGDVSVTEHFVILP